MTGVEQGRNASRACRVVICVLACVCIVGGFAACGDEKVKGEIVNVYQSLGGVVQTGIEVKLDDGETVDAWLPNDQAVWDRAEAGVSVELKPGDSEDTWEFVRFVEE